MRPLRSRRLEGGRPARHAAARGAHLRHGRVRGGGGGRGGGRGRAGALLHDYITSQYYPSTRPHYYTTLLLFSYTTILRPQLPPAHRAGALSPAAESHPPPSVLGPAQGGRRVEGKHGHPSSLQNRGEDADAGACARLPFTTRLTYAPTNPPPASPELTHTHSVPRSATATRSSRPSLAAPPRTGSCVRRSRRRCWPSARATSSTRPPTRTR
jgi:hypothetical protein